MSAKSIGEFISLRRSHNRHRIIRTKVSALCKSHGGVQKVTDYFKSPRGATLVLACGCRRPESAHRFGKEFAA